jgi:hypothetical protein
VTLAITIGRSRKNPRGRSVQLPDDVSPARALAVALGAQSRAEEAWWAPHTWKGNHRGADNWTSAIGVGVDVDYYDNNGEHVSPPAELAAAVDQAAREGKLPGSVYHATPRGFRVVFSLAAPLTDRELYDRTARGAAALVSAALRQLRLIGYIVDEGATLDTARLLFSPTAIVDQQARDAEVMVLLEEPYTAAALAPPPPRLAPALTFQDAARRFNQDHAQTWPRASGDCPACGHKECFGRLPEDPSRWACFSTNHTTPGARGAKCYYGDALDLAAHAAGLQPAELLRREGYLAAAVVDDTVLRRGPEQQQVPGTVVSIEQGKLRGLSKSYASLCAILRNDRKIIPDRLEWNDMLGNPTLGGVSLEDEDVAGLREKIELLVKDSRGKGLQFRTGDIEQAVKQVASERRYNPVREYLEHLEWDGTPRIAHVAEDILGIPATELTQVLLRKWFISAAARPLSPGCQVDHVLVLQGPQGPGKSTFFRKLAGDDWFTDQHFDIASDDGSRIVRRFWVIEWAELETMHRSRSGMVKGFISRRVDTFRPPYARRHVDAPRHCVIVGTVNPEKFLTDPTGNRRFWVIAVQDTFNLELLAEQRDQLWAEAVHLFRAGEQWHLTPRESELLAEAQEEFKDESHPWEGIVAEWLRGWTGDVTTAAVLEKAIRKPTGQWGKSDEMAVGKVLNSLGYERQRARKGELKDGVRERVYIWTVSPRSSPVPGSENKVGT